MAASAPETPRAAKPAGDCGVVRALFLALGVVAIVGGGFVWFVWHVPAEEVALDRNADGIVVLTGGASRIADAIELLAAGRGKRLLISGVHRATSSAEIARIDAALRGSGCVLRRPRPFGDQHHRQRDRDAALGQATAALPR